MSIIAVQGFGFAAKKHMRIMHRTNCKVVTVIVDVKLVQGVESLLLWLWQREIHSRGPLVPTSYGPPRPSYAPYALLSRHQMCMMLVYRRDTHLTYIGLIKLQKSLLSTSKICENLNQQNC